MDEREIFLKIMKKQVEPGELYEQLRSMHIRATYENAIYYQMVKKAAEGDLSAAKYILGAVQTEGDNPGTVDLSELSTAELQRMLEEEGHEA